MGCGASSNAQIIAVDGGYARELSLITLLKDSVDAAGKPVLGGTAADVVQGSPVTTGSPTSDGTWDSTLKELSDCVDADVQRRARMVQGLADAARASIDSNAIAAASLARAAASVAEAMPTGHGPGAAPNELASGFAASALASAKAGSETAAGLTETAVSTALAVAQARSKKDDEMAFAWKLSLTRRSSITLPPVIGKVRSSMKLGQPQVLTAMFRSTR